MTTTPKTVVQILAELSFGDGLLDVDIGCRHDPHVGLDRAARADRPHFALLQHAQELDLERRRHLADFVEKHGAGVRGLKHAFGVADRAGKRPFDMAEELGFEERFGERAAVDRDKRPRGAVAVLMNRARHQFLAGAALADDQDRRVGCRGVRDLFVDRGHQRAASEQRRRHVVANHRRLRRRRRLLQRALDEALELGDVERLADEIEGAFAHRLDGFFQLAEAGDDDDRRPWMRLADRAQHVDPVEPGVEFEIGDDQIERLRARARERLFGIAGRFDLPIGPIEQLLHEPAGARIVVEDENPRGAESAHLDDADALGRCRPADSIVNVVPRPTSLATVMLPPCAATTSRAIGKPEPGAAVPASWC